MTAERQGWYVEVWRARFGWIGSCVDYGDGQRIAVGPPDLWRPTRGWVMRVCLRYVHRQQAADGRRAQAETILP